MGVMSRMLACGVVGLVGSVLPAGAALAQEPKVLQLPIRTDGPKSLDPVVGSTTYDNMACVQFYETLLEPKYSNPYEYEPRLLADFPERLENGMVYRFRLKDGVVFHDPHAQREGRPGLFNGSTTRELTTDDVFYSLKRLADDQYALENWWLLENTIEGFDQYKNEQNAAAEFDYDAPVSGMVKIDDKTFEIRLTQPVTRFLWVLTMFQTAVVPREAVEFYGQDFGFNPVGTGPFTLVEFVPKRRLIAQRNTEYHDVRYPARDEWDREARRDRLHLLAGRRAPFVDRIEFTMFVEDQPMWLEFDAGNIAYTEVPAEYFERAFNKQTKELLPEYRDRGVRAYANPLLDFIFRGFNMEDELLGGYTPEKRALRQAINLAIDLNEMSESFYNGLTIQYDGPIPPGLKGHPEGGRAPVSYRGPDLERARQKLAEAGFPNGQGLPPIKFYTSRGGNNAEQVETMKRQLARVGIQLDPQLVDFSTLIEFVNNRKAPMFGFAWSSDYPDAENNLALFYGPNESPGSNHYNYQRPEYDEMYERILVMDETDERTELKIRMRDMLIEDAPFVGSMARTRHYLVNPWAPNLRPTERYWGWFKFVDVDNDKR